jgi:adenosyl cobinamide kinase/adenosyl cobinamide phosphate guanylyltransferase
MSTTTAPTINVTAEEVETFRMDPYYHGMMSITYAVDGEAFDDNWERSIREHREWLEAAQPMLERWVTVLRQLEDGVLPAEPWIIEAVRENAVGLHNDTIIDGHACDGSCNCADIAQRSAELHALADRLEGALVGSGVPA